MGQDRQFERDRVVICEGPTDKAFLRLLFPRNADPDFEIWEAGELNRGNGIDAYAHFLEAAIPMPSFEAKVRRLILFYDNDDDPDGRFRSLVEAIDKANASNGLDFYPIPKRPNAPARGKNIWVACIPVPGTNKRGALETMMVNLVKPAFKLKFECAKTTFNCSVTGGAAWSDTKRAKAQIVTALAHIHRKQPTAPLGVMIQKNAKVFDLEHRSIASIRKAILRSFA